MNNFNTSTTNLNDFQWKKNHWPSTVRGILLEYPTILILTLILIPDPNHNPNLNPNPNPNP